MTIKRWYIDPTGAKVTWGTAVISGVAQVDIREVVEVNGASPPSVRLWAGQHAPVDATAQAAATAAQNAGAVPTLEHPVLGAVPYVPAVLRPLTGATGARPAAATAGLGAEMYDTTLSKPIWSNGTVWKDAAGNTV